ncbi:hypothetical protein [Paractinoplanes hotanensis]|uniref:Uncharacterized protein n=1 Tax=Paractinoplanes hotanensis TaxID=2906497 RepID=A0ABT0Y6B5_9ACTN|nr:hypothetical protein [Actinoplanes hotanensis]MCM4080869.1 hypothetical protein [Actinoplanes hotanensis]
MPIGVTSILPASVATPFLEHARSKLGVMAKPPPPVYATEVVARSIVYAPGHPRREILVGGAAAAFALAQRLSPARCCRSAAWARARSAPTARATAWTTSTPRSAGRAGSGAFPGRALRRSPFTVLIGHLPLPAELLTSAVRRIQAAPGKARTDENAGRPRTVE